MDIVRDLLKLSAATSAPRVDAYSLASPSRSRELIAYHVRIMTQAGLVEFWSSVELTGNQTCLPAPERGRQFWSSVELTGNQTVDCRAAIPYSFGAVSN